MYVRIEKREDGMPDQSVDCERVVIDFDVDGPGERDTTSVTVEFDPNSGDDGEYRVIVDDECLWSALNRPEG